MQDLLLCIDGGGSGCRARLYDAAGKVLAEHSAGPCNPNNDMAQAEASLAALWQGIAVKAGLDASKPIAAALAGAGLISPNVRYTFQKRLSQFTKVKMMADGFAALVGAGLGAPCGMVAIGTGAVAHRLYADGSQVQRDGWGWLGADRGSGCWIGMRAVRHALAARDGVVQGGLLAKQINQIMGARDDELMNWLGDANAAKFASLVPVVMQAEQEQDATAQAIMQRAVEHIVALVECLQLPPHHCCYLAGSIALANKERIMALCKTQIGQAQADALTGCRLVAIGKVDQDGFAVHLQSIFLD